IVNLVRSAEFNGYPVLSKGGELIEYILKGNEQIVYQSLHNHSRVVVMRFELKFPVGYMGSTEVISKFFDSLRYRINSDLAKKTEIRCRTINSQIGYV
uniref:YagK/YfjJ domain-containing protein n=1 Tax=Shewanella sp. TB7-MNA-CIBAN-0143 TaxID=3140465 RepID=UPI00331B8314